MRRTHDGRNRMEGPPVRCESRRGRDAPSCLTAIKRWCGETNEQISSAHLRCSALLGWAAQGGPSLIF